MNLAFKIELHLATLSLPPSSFGGIFVDALEAVKKSTNPLGRDNVLTIRVKARK